MPKPKYEVIIYWSEEDQAFIAEVPELPGCAIEFGHRSTSACLLGNVALRSNERLEWDVASQRLRRCEKIGSVMLRVCDFFQFGRKVALKTKELSALKWAKIEKSHRL
jgi:hypothetical protein